MLDHIMSNTLRSGTTIIRKKTLSVPAALKITTKKPLGLAENPRSDNAKEELGQAFADTAPVTYAIKIGLDVDRHQRTASSQ